MPMFSAVRGFESTLQPVDEYLLTGWCLGDLLSHLRSAVPCPATELLWRQDKSEWKCLYTPVLWAVIKE